MFVWLVEVNSLPCRQTGPDGEIGKRCGLRSRWSNFLVSSSLTSGTTENEKSYPVLLQDSFLIMILSGPAEISGEASLLIIR